MTDRQELAQARAAAIANSRGPKTPGVPTRLDRWLRQNPNAFKTWEPKSGGYVVQFWGMKVYYGRCRDCDRLATTRRPAGCGGSWPQLCKLCRAHKDDDHEANARYRMARLRGRQYAIRAEQFERAGLPPVRQGVQSYLSGEPDDDLDDPSFWE